MSSPEFDPSAAPSAAERDASPDGAHGGDPYPVISAWMAEAAAREINDPDAMALATVDADGLPNVRMVLLKQLIPGDAAAGDPGGFVFYTNYDSAKGAELAAAPQAALALHWKSLRRQIRARGAVTRSDAAAADAYFASRSYQSRIGAWASAQSRPLSSRAALIAEAGLYAARYPLGPPRPPHWGGFRITPVEIEFWSDGAYRLHDRFRWRWGQEDGVWRWRATRLNP